VRLYRGGAGMWKTDTFALADYVLPTGKVRIRFVVKDSPDNGVTEAAVDDVFAEVLRCR